VIVALLVIAVAGTGAADQCGGGTDCACGDVVVADVTGDDIPSTLCRQNGLTIVEDDISIDCDGRTIVGQTRAGHGIVVEGASNVSIRDCQISGFYNGIKVRGSYAVSIENNTLSSNRASGISLHDVDASVVRHNRALKNWDGLYLEDSTGNVISENVVRRNTVNGLHLFYGAINNTVVNNDLERNGGHGIATAVCSNYIDETNTAGTGDPIRYLEDATDVTIEDTARYAEVILCNVSQSVIRNVTIHNGRSRSDGVLMVNSSHNNVVGSEFINTRTAVYLFRSSYDNTIAYNTVRSSDIGLRVRRHSNLNSFLHNDIKGTPIPVKTIKHASWNRFVDISIQDQKYTFSMFGSGDQTVQVEEEGAHLDRNVLAMDAGSADQTVVDGARMLHRFLNE